MSSHPRQCSDCAWILALHRGDVEDDIAAITTHDVVDADVIAAQLVTSDAKC